MKQSIMRTLAAPMAGAFLFTSICFTSICAAQDHLGATPALRKQLNDCMSRGMAANRTLSYNDAGKLCSQQLRAGVAHVAVKNDGLLTNTEPRGSAAKGM